MRSKPHVYWHEPDDQLPDISELATARLKPRKPVKGIVQEQQIAQRQAEMQRLSELAEAVEQAITALIVRTHMATERRLYEALEHNRADVQRYQGELEALRMEHERAIERLRAQQ